MCCHRPYHNDTKLSSGYLMPSNANANKWFLHNDIKWKLLFIHVHLFIYGEFIRFKDLSKIFMQRRNYTPRIHARVYSIPVPFSSPNARIPAFRWIKLCTKIDRICPTLTTRKKNWIFNKDSYNTYINILI